MLWIYFEFSCRRRTGEEDGRIRLGMDRRSDVCGGGQACHLVCELVFKATCGTPEYVRNRLTVDVHCVSRGTGAKRAGGVDKEHLMQYDMVKL